MTINAHLRHEFALLDKGYTVIAGLDEAGRGAWAGPVFAGAVILPLDRADLIEALDGVRDSKLISPGRREKLFPRILEIALTAGVGSASNAEIDQYGIVPATRLAMQRALEKLSMWPNALLTDVIKLPEVDLPAFPLVKGDQVSLSIAAASILAKVSRDHVMIELNEQYPEYGFAAHKGYGTARHHEALRTYGPADIHRHTFAPIRALRGKRRAEPGK